MQPYPKKIRQKLRELSSLADDRELNQKLDELHIKFQRWKSGEIDGLQLHDRFTSTITGRVKKSGKFTIKPTQISL